MNAAGSSEPYTSIWVDLAEAFNYETFWPASTGGQGSGSGAANAPVTVYAQGSGDGS